MVFMGVLWEHSDKTTRGAMMLIVIMVSLWFMVALMIFYLIKSGICWMVVDNKGIRLKNIFGTIKAHEWSGVKNIFINNFKGTEKLPAVMVYGTQKVNVPKKMPTKWIYVSISEEYSGENILEYLLSPRKDLSLIMRYSEKIVLAIKQFYKNDLVEKTVHII